ncbi:hypothetical protein J32TS6_16150 [Virgibacillus pantothenticus]|uniref:hypothetical protein n=1 Tax=Virgibacillus TaxID=84406 RepID=UPI00090CBB2F|nr:MULTISPECIES: hypothetical protein [Virgibacillus]API92472.1 hypothetical protein BKP57_11985 [Virgibacillus sp. 6R]MBS7427980.1 hypothetical protein [Virgibacillus sp. 19R1-5]GIP63060.1 hypothetical protein J32TS6_16150 [Virgibacillus pantothenticus]
MISKIKKLLEILEILNSRTNIVENDEIVEQFDNLKDIKELSSELDEILINFNNLNLGDGDEVEEMLFEIHRILTTFEWHFSEISDLNTKIIKEYKDKVNNDH